jgi:hypothetical protein
MYERIRLTGTALAGLAFLWAAGPAWAQVYNPGAAYSRPVVSPYINLLRGTANGVNPAINYYGIVRPEIDFRRSLIGLQGQVTAEQQEIAAQEQYGVQPFTGHAAFFRNYSHYFPGGAGQNIAIGPRAGSTAPQRPATTSGAATSARGR